MLRNLDISIKTIERLRVAKKMVNNQGSKELVQKCLCLLD